MASNHQPGISHHAALIYIMVIVSAVDREMPDSEFRLIGRLSAQLPAFEGFDRNKLIETAQECAVAILQTKDGLDRLLRLVAQALSHDLRETADADGHDDLDHAGQPRVDRRVDERDDLPNRALHGGGLRLRRRKIHPGKHPNIDRLFAIMNGGAPCRVALIAR